MRPSFPPFPINRFRPDCNRNEILSRSNCAQVESVASLYYFGLQPIVLESWITSLTMLRNASIGASGMGIDIKKVTLLP